MKDLEDIKKPGVGLHFKMPILDRVARRVSLKEQVVDFEPQAVITKIMLRCRLIPSYSIRSLTEEVCIRG